MDESARNLIEEQWIDGVGNGELGTDRESRSSRSSQPVGPCSPLSLTPSFSFSSFPTHLVPTRSPLADSPPNRNLLDHPPRLPHRFLLPLAPSVLLQGVGAAQFHRAGGVGAGWVGSGWSWGWWGDGGCVFVSGMRVLGRGREGGRGGGEGDALWREETNNGLT